MTKVGYVCVMYILSTAYFPFDIDQFLYDTMSDEIIATSLHYTLKLGYN